MVVNKNWLVDVKRLYQIKFREGDIVEIARKKRNGYPKFLEMGKHYFIRYAENEFVWLGETKNDVISKCVKIHNSFIITSQILRDKKIEDILGNI